MKYLKIINLLAFFLLLYMFFSVALNIIEVNTVDNKLQYYQLMPISNPTSDKPDYEMNKFIIDNIANYEITLNANQYYYYSNDEDIIQKYKQLIKRDVDDPILLNKEVYYLNNYKDIYHFEGEDYNIGGLFDKTIIPINYVSNEKINNFNSINLYGEKKEVDKLITDLNENGFEMIANDQVYSNGQYDVEVTTVILSFITTNLSLILISIIMLISTELSLKSRNDKINFVMKSFGYKTANVIKYYLKIEIKDIFLAISILLLLILTLDLLNEKYIFLSGVTFNKIAYICTIIVCMLYILIVIIKKMISYNMRARKNA